MAYYVPIRSLCLWTSLSATFVKRDIRVKQLIEYKITPKGKDQMKRAIDENVRCR